VFGRPPQSFSALPEPNSPSEVADTLLSHFFPPYPPPPRLLSLVDHEDYPPLTAQEISRALTRLSNTCAPGPDQIPYSVRKTLYCRKLSLLLPPLNPLLIHCFHPPSLKKSLGLILNKAGKSSYDISCLHPFP